MIDALGGIETLLVLGGYSDIGLATAERLVTDGCRRVALAGRDAAKLERAAERLRSLGAEEVTELGFDALDFASHEAVVARAFDTLGDVDVVLISFGVLGNQAEAERDPSVAREIIETNFTAAASVGLSAAARLRNQGYGCLVYLSSVAGERARRSNFVYGSSKAGADAFFQGLGAALEESGVRVLVVRPGFVKTRMTEGLSAPPLSTTPDKVAAAVVRGVVERKELVWVPPAMRAVMAVLRHLPTPLFRKLPI